MKAGTLLLMAGLAFLGYEAWQLAVGTGTMQVILQGVQINSLTNYVVTLTAQNVSDASITINAMTGNILINGNQLATIATTSIPGWQPIVIPARGQANIPINVSPDLLSLPADIQQLINNGGQTIDFTVQGDINASGFVLPFTLDKTVTL